MVTEVIDGKEINPNSLAMFILNQDMATTDLRCSYGETRGNGCLKMGYFFEVETHTHSLKP